ncbi:DUF484 family protein [Neiella marina]|uniref:DUF484 family protein n=1 Tax=Neiella holothuriorum TaxID=2870530 RepID=A0ABS7ECA0_9GAMM|nr:DUF484 family protein [Neiella holothuriorum]MBW8189957.1 DUF484 family protein [Neiella holothuriorum]
MSNDASQEAMTCETNAGLDDAQVRAYLEAHPAFFERQSDLLADVRLPHAQRGSISLVDRQLDKLREQNGQLREEITALMTVAKHNESIYQSFCQLYVALLPCQSINDIHQQIQQVLSELLNLSAITMWPLADQQDWVPRRKPVDNEALQQLQRRRLQNGAYYFGRLNDADKALLFDDQHVESAALMTLEEGSILLAFGSADVDHFNPNLDVLLLDQLRTLLSAVLKQLRERRNG